MAFSLESVPVGEMIRTLEVVDVVECLDRTATVQVYCRTGRDSQTEWAFIGFECLRDAKRFAEFFTNQNTKRRKIQCQKTLTRRT